MPNVIEAKIMQDHSIPVTPLELVRDVSRNIVVHLGKVLHPSVSPSTP